MVLERVLFGQVALPGEGARIAVALAGLAITSYFDIFNKRNVPNTLLYAFLAIAFITNLLLFENDLFIFSIATAVIIGGLGYLLYLKGQLGGADVIVFVALVLLLPVHPSLLNFTFNYPFVFSVLVFAGILLALYTTAIFGFKLFSKNTKKSKPNLLYLLLGIPYVLFLYVYMQLPLFSPTYLVFFSILFLSALFVMIYKNDIEEIISRKIRLSEVKEEDVLALDRMKELAEKYKLQKLVTGNEIKRLKQLKINEVYVYTDLPPFLPFLFAGFLLALLLGRMLIL